MTDSPSETIAALIEGDDRDSEATEPGNSSPRAWGFDVEEINRCYALAIWGGKAVVVNEQPSGPVNDRVRVMSFDSMNSWFANRYTEIVGSDGKVRPVTWRRLGTHTPTVDNTRVSSFSRIPTGRRVLRIT
jgi:hypothetical protein